MLLTNTLVVIYMKINEDNYVQHMTNALINLLNFNMTLHKGQKEE